MQHDLAAPATGRASTPMSMLSVIGAGDDQATVAAAVPAVEERGTPGLGAAMPVVVVALSTPLLLPSQMVVVVLDATRDHREEEVRTALRALVARGDMLRGGDSLLVLVVLHTISNPTFGLAANLCSVAYKFLTRSSAQSHTQREDGRDSPPCRPDKVCSMYHADEVGKASTDSFSGASSWYLNDQVRTKAEFYQKKLHHDVEELRKIGIRVTLKVSSGSPAKSVIICEVNSSKAAWVVLDRHFRRDFKHIEKHIACKIATIQDNLSVQPWRTHRTRSSKSMVEAKALQDEALSLDLTSKTLDTDIFGSLIKSSPVVSQRVAGDGVDGRSF